MLRNEGFDEVNVKLCKDFPSGTFSNIGTTTDDKVGLDMKAIGQFGCLVHAYWSFSVKIMNLFAKKYQKGLPNAYKYHESYNKNSTEKFSIKNKIVR